MELPACDCGADRELYRYFEAKWWFYLFSIWLGCMVRWEGLCMWPLIWCFLILYRIKCKKCQKILDTTIALYSPMGTPTSAQIHFGAFSFTIDQWLVVLPALAFGWITVTFGSYIWLADRATPSWSQYNQDCGLEAQARDFTLAYHTFQNNYLTQQVFWRGEAHLGWFVRYYEPILPVGEDLRYCVQMSMNQTSPSSSGVNVCFDHALKNREIVLKHLQEGTELEYSGLLRDIGDMTGPYLSAVFSGFGLVN